MTAGERAKLQARPGVVRGTLSARPAGKGEGGASAAELRIFLCAARGDLGETVSLVGRHPALVHARDTRGATPLHHAAFHGAEMVSLFLLQRSADPNARSLVGSTPLHLALRGRAPRCLAERLLAHNASALAIDGTGAMPSALALALAKDEALAASLVESAKRESAALSAALAARADELDATARRLALLTRLSPAVFKCLVLGLSGAGRTALCISAMSGGMSGGTADDKAAPLTQPPSPSVGMSVRAVGRSDAPPFEWAAHYAHAAEGVSVTLQLVDVGGDEAVRAYWPQLLQDASVSLVVFVVDAAERDEGRWALAAAAHASVAAACGSRTAAGKPALPLLTVASKADLAGARTPGEVEALLSDAALRAGTPTVLASSPQLEEMQSRPLVPLQPPAAAAVLAASGRTGAGVAAVLDWCAQCLSPSAFSHERSAAPSGFGPLHELRRSRLQAGSTSPGAVTAVTTRCGGDLRASSARLTLAQQVQRFAGAGTAGNQ